MSIPFYNPLIGDLEKQWVIRCLDSGYVSSVGPLVGQFEEAFARRVGARYAVATASGTAALHVALRALNLGPGDRVIVPDLTFVASVNPVLYNGAEPVLADVSPDTWVLHPGFLRELCRRLAQDGHPARAVIPVHLFGGSCDMLAIREVAREFNLRVIEDATEALGTRRADRQAGTFGDVGCFSFNGNKMITTGGGGMAVTDDERLAQTMRHLVNQARLDPSGYVHDTLGYNYRMTNLTAALGLAQLARLDGILARKRVLGERYRNELRSLPGLTCTPEQPDETHCFWLYSIVLNDPMLRSAWMETLSRAGIPSRPFFTPLHRQPYLNRPFWRAHAGLPVLSSEGVSDRLAAAGLNLPSSPDMTDEQQAVVLKTLRALALSAGSSPRNF